MKLSGVYLVIDPSKPDQLLDKLSQALNGGVGIVQIWNHWPSDFGLQQKESMIAQIKQLATTHQVPVLMHDDWSLALATGLDGVHFDEIPDNWEIAKPELSGKIIGFTVGNDLQKIEWANEQKVSYLSFCAMFPSPSVDSCEIVTPDVVRKTRALTDLPLFLSGGIRPDNLEQLSHLDFQGVAVISGIMSVENPAKAVIAYSEKLKALSI